MPTSGHGLTKRRAAFAALLVALAAPVYAGAANPVAKIGDVPYSSLQDAVDAAGESDTVVLTARISEPVAITKTVNFKTNSKFDGTFTGDGTIVISEPLSGISAATWPEGWTGTVLMNGLKQVTAAFSFTKYGNANSTVRVNGVTVWPGVAEEEADIAQFGTLEIAGGGLAFAGDTTISGKTLRLSAALAGSGAVSFETRSGDNASHGEPSSGTKYVLTGDRSLFSGAIDITKDTTYNPIVVFAKEGDNIPVPSAWGQVIITENEVFTARNSLYAPGGLFLAGRLVLSPAGSVTLGRQDTHIVKDSDLVVSGTAAISGEGELSVCGDVVAAGSGAKLILENVTLKNAGGNLMSVSIDVDLRDGAGLAADKYTEYAAKYPIELRGSVFLGGDITVSDASHAFLGNVSVVDDASIHAGVGSHAGSLDISGRVQIAGGKSLTLPASGVAAGANAGFELLGPGARLVDNSGTASGKVTLAPGLSATLDVKTDGLAAIYTAKPPASGFLFIAY